MEPENVTFIHKIKLYALFINGNYKTALYRQLFVIQRCPLRQVRLFTNFQKIKCPLYTGLTVFEPCKRTIG
jgi:hypothetical protein